MGEWLTVRVDQNQLENNADRKWPTNVTNASKTSGFDDS